MKKIIRVLIGIFFFYLIIINIMIFIDKNNKNNISKLINKNTDIKNISYINQYGDRYIVKDKKYLYLLDKKYKKIDKLEIKNIYDNNKKYDIVYRNEKFMYMDESKNKNCIIYMYYDIFNYKLIEKIVVGGS